VERQHGLPSIAAALRDRPDAARDACLDLFEGSALRLPGRVDRAGLARVVTPVLEALGEAMAAVADDARGATPGSAALREVEKALSFVGASMAGVNASAFDASALALALRDALAANAADAAERARCHALFEWFTALVMQGFATARGDAAGERHRDQLEECAPVVLIAPDLPAAFPIGDERINGVDAVFARLLMLIVRVGARAAIVDPTGLADRAAPTVLEALTRLCNHRKFVESVTLVVVGLDEREAREWRRIARAARVPLQCTESFVDAVRGALELTEHALVRRTK
jgi:hypothetical protein